MIWPYGNLLFLSSFPHSGEPQLPMYFTHQVVKKTAYSLYSVHPPLDLGLALQSLATPRVVCGQQHLHPLEVFLLCFFF